MAKEKKKKDKAAKPKPNYQFDRSIKVKQSTIDRIKAKGMEGALKSGKGNAEYEEAIKRLYGARRYKEAGRVSGTSSRPSGSSKPSGRPSGTIAARAGSAGPMMGGGVGRAKPSKKSNRGAAVAAGLVAAGAAGVYAKGKSVQKKLANMTAAEKKAYKAKMEKRTASLTKLSQSKTGKAIGKVSRAATSKTAMGAAAIYGGSKAVSKLRDEAKKTAARRRAGMKDKSVGGARATAIKKSRGR